MKTFELNQLEELVVDQLQNTIGGSPFVSGRRPIATTGYSILLSDGIIVPNTGSLPNFPLSVS